MSEEIQKAIFACEDAEYDVIHAYRKLRSFQNVPECKLLFDELGSLLKSFQGVSFDKYFCKDCE